MKTMQRVIMITVVILCNFLQCAFAQKQDEIFLIYPLGEEHSSNNTPIKYLTFKSDGDQLLIDTTYNLKSNHFTKQLSESSRDYPSLTLFLRKTLPEYQYIENLIDEKACDNLSPCYIQIKSGSGVELIHFKRINDCNSSHDGNLGGLYEELQVLAKKYSR